MNFFDADCGHVKFFFSRSVMLDVRLGFTWPTSGGCAMGESCGRFSGLATLTFGAGLFWNFDTGPGGS
jgi:hypothetical protein